MEDHFKTGVPNGALPALFVPKRRDSPATEDVKRDDTRLDLWGSNGSPDPLGLIWEIRIPERGDLYHQRQARQTGRDLHLRP